MKEKGKQDGHYMWGGVAKPGRAGHRSPLVFFFFFFLWYVIKVYEILFPIAITYT